MSFSKLQPEGPPPVRFTPAFHMKNAIIVGISGATCGGKTTLSKLLHATFPWSKVIHQDAYFHPNDPKYHVYLPEIDCFNWELESALDFERMENDVVNLLKGNPITPPQRTPFFDNGNFVVTHLPPRSDRDHYKALFTGIPIIILEGHILFNRPLLNNLCTQKFFLKLGRQVCFERRQRRLYDPPPPAEFFDVCVWPSYEKRLEYVEGLEGITYLDGEATDLLQMFGIIMKNVLNVMHNIVDVRGMASGKHVQFFRQACQKIKYN